MKHLLKTYGNEICLLDVIYETTRNALPLFLMVVKTNNVDYEVVGAFECEGEGTENMPASKIQKSWNPDCSSLL